MPLLRFIRRVVSRSLDDGIAEHAAAAAFHLFFTLFAVILGLFALTGLLGGDAVFSWLMARLRETMPEGAAEYVGRFVAEVTGTRRPAVVTLGFVLALGSGSSVLQLLGRGLNRVFRVCETRRWWVRWLSSSVGLASFLVLVVAAVLGVLVAPPLLARFGVHPAWSAVNWVLTAITLVVVTWLLYVLLPNRRGSQRLWPTLAGAVVGGGLWLGSTLGFRLYLASFPAYSRIYGFVGAIMIVLVWLYLAAGAFLFGAEVAATLEDDR